MFDQLLEASVVCAAGVIYVIGRAAIKVAEKYAERWIGTQEAKLAQETLMAGLDRAIVWGETKAGIDNQIVQRVDVIKHASDYLFSQAPDAINKLSLNAENISKIIDAHLAHRETNK